MRKPNYRFERAERDRLKRAKKEEKARRQQERPSDQKSEEAGQPAPSGVSDDVTTPPRYEVHCRSQPKHSAA
jgi:hypothetical protein